ncbi:MAG: aminomethyl-transferring glycine dehydrogenase [Acidobacteria bacterium]|nr:aminomethyl-transferring glycine dehydrogenase [Acidobacteriota bacterium]
MSVTDKPIRDLEMGDDFVSRHIGPRESDCETMLEQVGASSLTDLVDQTLPGSIRSAETFMGREALSEREALSVLRSMASKNELKKSLIGMGYYDTVTPPVILRNVLENPGWYTAYTPYQAEVSQGRMEALLNYQQMVMDLTGMDLANASLLDEATAAAEALTLSRRVSKASGQAYFVDADCHPQTLAVVQTRAEPLGIEVIVGDPATDLDAEKVFGVLVQYPGSSGEVRDPRAVIEKVHAVGGIVTVASDLLALCLLASPGSMGADVVLGSAQRFGVPMGYGGPHAAFFATRDAYKRQTPGRIIGVSVDADGNSALRMALQTREQHIRREKATSNICTAQVLLAVIAGCYAVYHGPDRLRTIAARVHRIARVCAAGLRAAGFEVVTESFFDTLTVRVPGEADAVVERALVAGFNLRQVDEDHVGLSFDETSTAADVAAVLAALASEAPLASIDDLDASVGSVLSSGVQREDDFMTHPVFHAHHSETEMLRYLRQLAAKDIALDRSMIPLGSCTMKLNATTEMIPVTWPEFGGMHPFVPVSQAAGYRELTSDLEAMLCEITGFDAVSLQPNAGSQGEYAGLLCIRRYHQSRGDEGRDVCLIPVSAHGTNPASATMAGMRVVLVACDDEGNVDLDDLRARASEHAESLGALMITYPSTHGVFEEAFVEICEVVHEHGGQVYMDGANLNAMVGLCEPGKIGADVAHLNLHKTFCIPHGGGGPGVGPIGVGSHLAPFLPDHPVVAGVNPVAAEDGTIGAVAAAPWGSASILPISWAYIAMMGSPGLEHATGVAILSANYIAKRLSPHYPVLYTGANDRVAHECIIDLRPIKDECGISVDDVAKRLADYGFHAPTMSFPVAGTLMIEPTESEPKAELDRFCDAMISIRAEIAEVESGAADPKINVLTMSPHSHRLAATEEWERPYSRQRALFPAGTADKYWPPVGRVDNVYGDRNLTCSCPPIEAYAEAE